MSDNEFNPEKFAVEFLKVNAREITKGGKSLFLKARAKLTANLGSIFNAYATKFWKDFSRARTILHREPTSLHSFYVPCSISSQTIEFESPTITGLYLNARSIIVAGSAGTGKSIFLRYLALQCLREHIFLPVFLELRSLNDSEISLYEELYIAAKKISPNLSDLDFKEGLNCGLFSIFLDGFDEVRHSRRAKLEKEIAVFRGDFPEILLIMSSRPESQLNDWPGFQPYNIQPLSLRKAQLLIELVDFNDDIKTKFLREFDAKLFEKHESFLSNPLLLSIMLLSYGQSADIPNKLSIFYAQAFEALFQRHDTLKGAFKREILSGLDILDFGKLFSAFCLLTYDDRKFSFNYESALSSISKAKEISMLDCDSSRYLEDVCKAVCLLTEDGLDYIFTHRSFQEYFTAKFIAAAPEALQKNLIERFSDNYESDNVLLLISEIRPDVFDKYFLIPQLRKIANKLKIKKISQNPYTGNILPGAQGVSKSAMTHFSYMEIEKPKILSTI